MMSCVGLGRRSRRLGGAVLGVSARSAARAGLAGRSSRGRGWPVAVSGGGGERSDAREGGLEVVLPGPAGGQVQCPAACVASSGYSIVVWAQRRGPDRRERAQWRRRQRLGDG